MRHPVPTLLKDAVLLPLPPGEGGGEGPQPLNMRCAFLGAGAGSSPRRASHFLCFAKESNQRKATPLSATPALRFGATCGARFSRGLARTRLRLRQSRALIREKLRSSAQPEGSGSGLRFARPPEHPTASTQNTSTRHGAYLFNPLWACRGAQLQADKGPRVSEPKASLRGPRLKRAPQVARSEAEGHAQWGRLLLLTFLGETRKVSRPPGRIPGSGATSTAMPNRRPSAPTPTLPQRGRE